VYTRDVHRERYTRDVHREVYPGCNRGVYTQGVTEVCIPRVYKSGYPRSVHKVYNQVGIPGVYIRCITRWVSLVYHCGYTR